MRLFIAVDLPEDVKDEVITLQNPIGSSDAKISWVAKKNLHLTLKFLGEISEEKVDAVKDVLKKISFELFELQLNNFGAFPSINNPRILWVGLKDEDNIIKLARLIDSETLKFSESDLNFKAHLTIGRVKLIKFKEPFISKLKKIKVKNIKFKVDSFTLYKSKLASQGAEHNVVERFMLN